MHIQKAIRTAGLMLLLGWPISIQGIPGGGKHSAETPPQKALRYVNPLVIEEAGWIADPAVIRVKDLYYLYLTGGCSPDGLFGAVVWSSRDLVHWENHKVAFQDGRDIEAPAVFEYDGYIYLTGNDIGLFRSRDPLGPFEYLGDFMNENGQRLERALCHGCENGGVFDPAFFANDDGRVYLYYAGGGTDGIYGVELDPTDLRKLLGPAKHFFHFETTHIWERYGNWNEYSEQSWIEGPWMTEHNGIYYLQYAAPGTDWKTYAVGVYTGKNPLGPFTYYTGSPILRHRGGLINGTAHHSVVEGPDGNLWAIYTLLYRNWNRIVERRIGMDPVGFDARGNMFVKGPSETPEWAPGVKARPWEDNDSGSIPLSEDKTCAVSSEAPGRNPAYAVDGNPRTWWAPAQGDKEPWLTLDLGAESKQMYLVDSARILFTLPEGLKREGDKTRIRKYKIEVSSDGINFRTVVDKTHNYRDNAVEFDEIAPVKCRHVKLTIIGWPQGLSCGVIEFTVFGRPTPL